MLNQLRAAKVKADTEAKEKELKAKKEAGAWA